MLCFLAGLLLTQVCPVHESAPSCTVNGSLRMYAIKGFVKQFCVSMAVFKTITERC